MNMEKRKIKSILVEEKMWNELIPYQSIDGVGGVVVSQLAEDVIFKQNPKLIKKMLKLILATRKDKEELIATLSIFASVGYGNGFGMYEFTQ
ncbi:hypothetical protein [Priestia megaterium]|uniref:hypothetical protein n=1 Tax=Priestia megaterium TaxID=1404 RepID=UPI00363E573E